MTTSASSLNPTPEQIAITASHKPTPGRSLIASATRLTSAQVRGGGLRASSSQWQEDAWDTYDLVGEQRFLASTLANRMAQARLYCGLLGDNLDEPEPVEPDHIGAEILGAIGGGPGGLGQIIRRLGVNLFTPGEGWLIGIPGGMIPAHRRTRVVRDEWEPGSPLLLDDLEWLMLSVSEVATDSTGAVSLRLGTTEEDTVKVDPDQVYLIRIWRPHPRRYWEADSPTRSSLPVLRELIGLTMHISAQIDSRLAGAGVLLVPRSAQDALRRELNIEGEEGADPFTENLIEAMLTPITDRSNASALVPLVITVPDEVADKFNHLTFDRPLDVQAKDLRDEAIRRLALGQDAPPELLLGVECVDTETTILTAQGWKTYDEVREGDLVLTLNHETGVSEWQPVLAMNVFERVAEPMLRMSGKGHDSLTTLNHRWPVTSANHDRREFVTSADLNTGHLIPTSAPHADLPTEAKFSDAFVELVAWFWTEGHYGPRTGRWGQASIAQSVSKNPGRVDAIRLALDTSFPSGWGTETRQRGEWDSDVVRFNLRRHVYEALAEVGGKHVTLDFIRSLTRSQLELFIDISAQGDGWHYSDGRLDIWQRDPSALDAYELALILSGRTVTRTQYADGEVVNSYVKDTVRPIKAGIATEEVYTGTVWCPTTENGTWFARRNGTTWFTGNSMNHWGAWLVREDVVTTHLEPPLALICDALTSQYLRPMLVEQGMSEDEAARYVIWYDVSHLITRPNRSGDATNLYDRNELSGEALRSAHGFDENDAPKAVEGLDPAVERALDMVTKAPSLAADPGLEELVAQIRAVLDPDSTAASPEAAPAPAPGDQERSGADDAGPPDTEDAPAEPSESIAAAGKPLGVPSDRAVPVLPIHDDGDTDQDVQEDH